MNDEYAACISGQSISEITVWDKSVFHDKVTFGRVVFLGLLAFAVPKREKISIYHLVITWQDGQFTHHTVLEYRGYQPLERGNNARNMLIRELNNSPSI